MVTKKREADDKKASSKAKQPAKKQKVDEHAAYEPKSTRKQTTHRPPAAGNTGTKAPAQQPKGPPQPAPYQPETSELEKKRLNVVDELRNVEKQIFDLETKYLEQSSNSFGNAIRGYEGFLGGLGVANRKIVVKPEERLFSSSSLTGQVGTAND